MAQHTYTFTLDNGDEHRVKSSNPQSAFNALRRIRAAQFNSVAKCFAGFERSGKIHYHELEGRVIAPPQKSVKKMDMGQDFDFLAEVDAQCGNTEDGAVHE